MPQPNPFFFDPAETFQSGQDSKCTIQAAAVWNRVEMRAHQHDRAAGLPAGEDVPRRIHPAGQAGDLDPPQQPAAGFQIGLAPRRPGHATLRCATYGTQLGYVPD